MRKNLKRIEAALSHQSFPLYFLAAVGVFTMPHAWFALATGLLLISVFYSYLKRNPGILLNPKELVKRPEVLRFAVIMTVWFWWGLLSPLLQGGLFSGLGFMQGAVFALIWLPVLLSLVFAACFYRAWPRGLVASGQPDSLKKIQLWTNATLIGFLEAFALSVTTFVWFPGGVGTWLNDWLICSARDASLPMNGFTQQHWYLHGTAHHLWVTVSPAQIDQFSILVNSGFSLALLTLVWPYACRLACFLTLWLKRICQSGGWTDSFMRTLRLPNTTLKLKEANPFSKNAAASFLWILACYLALFGLFGFSTGPLGQTITGWFNACITDANTGMFYGASANPHLRIFCGAIVALYGAIPLAVTGSVFIPYFRRRQIVLNPEGVLFPDGPYLAFGFRLIRLWSDFASVDVQLPAGVKKPHAGKLVVKFHSGGKIVLKLSQLASADLEKFLTALDENATECRLSDNLINLRSTLRFESTGPKRKTDLGSQSAEQFQSTIFVPHQPGDWLPDGEMRVVSLLASRPLSCVYLVRSETGKLAIAKQFFLADDTEETQSLRKCFEREYELLQGIDHSAVSKVLSVFHRDQSTYLLIEHAGGTDFRTLVSRHGPQPEEKVITWALELCYVMSYLHSQNPPIVHRDLTPDNLVLAENGSVQVIDFGAAHQFLEGITGTIIGKQCYISPEQLQGHAGIESDIYSFGCMLHFLLTGEEPIALTQCKPAEKADVSPELNALVMACTEFDQHLRPQSFEEVRDQLLSAREKPIQDVIAKLKEVAQSQGIGTKPQTKAGSPESNEDSDSGTVINIKEYQEQPRKA